MEKLKRLKEAKANEETCKQVFHPASGGNPLDEYFDESDEEWEQAIVQAVDQILLPPSTRVCLQNSLALLFAN